MPKPLAAVLLAAAIAVLALAGCATAPIGASSAERVTPSAFRAPAANTAQLVVTRDTGFTSSACATHVYVNGELAVDLRPGQTVTMHVPVGEVIVGAQPASICAGGLVEASGAIKRGDTLRYRIGYDQNGGIGLFRTAVR